MFRSALLLTLPALLLACEAPPQANPEFSDATSFAFASFEEEEPAVLAFALRRLEREIYLGMDIEASRSADRALTPEQLTEEQVASIEHPDRPVRNNIAVAVGAASAFSVAQLAQLPVMDDQLPFEPGSPEHYERSFLEGTESCWPGQGCETLRTSNDLTKDNAAIDPITYTLQKDYRWVDLGLPDPADVPTGEPIVNEGAPRWAFVARSWMPARAENDSGDSIEQSFTVEVWIPRDGGGFVRDGSETNRDDGDWTGDSEGGDGTLRMMALWSESIIDSIDADPETVASVTRIGIDDIFEAVEEWMEDNAGTLD